MSSEKLEMEEEDEGPIMQLPFEILLHIFSFSSRKELDTIHQLVCHRWREVVCDWAMWKRNCSNEFMVDNLFNPSKLDWKATFMQRRKMWKFVVENRLFTPSPCLPLSQSNDSIVASSRFNLERTESIPDERGFFAPHEEEIDDQNFENISDGSSDSSGSIVPAEERQRLINMMEEFNISPAARDNSTDPLGVYGDNNEQENAAGREIMNPLYAHRDELILLDPETPNVAIYVGWDRSGVDSQAVGVVQSVHELGLFPFGDVPFFSYFEVKILNDGKRGYIGIGIAPKGYKNAEPGWRSGSFGYHGDDGRVYNNSGWGKAWGPTYKKGDVIGCLVNTKSRNISFTKNGVNLGIAFANIQLLQCEYCMTVGLHSNDEEISVNFGKEPFLFDVKEYARETFFLEIITAEDPNNGHTDNDSFKDLLDKISRNEEIEDTPEMQTELKHLVKAITPLYNGQISTEMPPDQIQNIIRSLILEDPISMSDEEDDQEYQEKEGVFTEAISHFSGKATDLDESFGISDNFLNDSESELNISQRELRAIANGALEVDSPEGVNQTARMHFSQQYDEYFPPSDESFGSES